MLVEAEISSVKYGHYLTTYYRERLPIRCRLVLRVLEQFFLER